MITDEIFTKNGESHYYWPHLFDGGNSTKCGGCRYFAEDEKSKSPYFRTGECKSIAHQTDRGSIHRQNGWDRTASSSTACRWWFPIAKQPGEQEELHD